LDARGYRTLTEVKSLPRSIADMTGIETAGATDLPRADSAQTARIHPDLARWYDLGDDDPSRLE
jgi:hypothetical protein